MVRFLAALCLVAFANFGFADTYNVDRSTAAELVRSLYNAILARICASL